MIRTETVDIRIFPKKVRTHPAGSKIQIGDLHGNPIRLLYTLYTEGVIRLSKESFDTMVSLYTALYPYLLDFEIQTLEEQVTYFQSKVDKWLQDADSKIRHQTYLELNQEKLCESIDKKTWLQKHKYTEQEMVDMLLNEIRTIQLCPNAPFVDIIGDETGDRGIREDFIIEILKHLDKQNAQFDIMSSNHGLWFIEWMQTGVLNAQVKHLVQGRSLLHFARNHEYTNPDLQDFFLKVYLKRLKLIKIEEVESIKRGRRAINVTTHAAIDLNEIQKVAAHLNVDFDSTDMSIENLIDVSNRINVEYVTQVKDRTIQVEKIGNISHPLGNVHWARPGLLGYGPLLSAPKGLDFDVVFSHGHQEGPSFCPADQDFEISLDTNLGKYPTYAEYGDYCVDTYIISVLRQKPVQNAYTPQFSRKNVHYENVSLTRGVFVGCGIS